jgi:Tol biopolymer transport system component
MSEHDDLERDIAEEDEMRSLLNRREELDIPPFAHVTSRANGSSGLPVSAAIAAAVLIVVAGLVLIRGGTGPATPTTGSPAAVASASAEPSRVPYECGLPSSLALTRHVSGNSLITSLEYVQPTDQQTNQVNWIVRFLLDRGASAPAMIGVQAEITIISPGGRSFLQVLGYDQIEPNRGSLKEGDSLTLDPCKALTLQIRTGGPVRDGVFTYDVAIHKVGLPEGGTIQEHLTVELSCSSRTRSCDRVVAGVSPAPTPTPNAALFNPSFGIIYSGIRQGYAAGSSMQVRREGETKTAVAELAPSYFNQWNGAVAPDGRRAVYFAQPQGQPWTLFLFDGAKPNEQRALVALPGEVGLQSVWSGDGAGVAFVVIDQLGNGATPAYSAIRTLDLASGVVTERARVTGGSAYTLVGWDRANATLAAMVVPHADQGPITYLVLSGTNERSWTLEAHYSAVASPDGRDVVGVKCEGVEIGCSLWTWKLGDFDTRVDRKIGNRLSIGVIGWRPGTNEFAFAVSDINAGAAVTIELLSLSGGPTRIVFGSSATYDNGSFFRADGTALIVVAELNTALVVDLTSGRTTQLPLPTPDPAFEIGRPTASVRLGS